MSQTMEGCICVMTGVAAIEIVVPVMVWLGLDDTLQSEPLDVHSIDVIMRDRGLWTKVVRFLPKDHLGRRAKAELVAPRGTCRAKSLD